MIEFRNVTKEYKGSGGITKALKGISFKINNGENIALTGRSGSGKTSLLLLAAAVLSPDKGEIIYNQEDLADFSKKKKNQYRLRNVSLVMQSDNLIPFMTLRENYHLLQVSHGFAKAPDSDIRESFAEAGIADKINSYPFELSAGEAQRAAIIIGFSAGAGLLLLDEPTANLDRNNSAILTQLLKQKNRQGATIIAATHDLELADSFSRIIELDDGLIHNDKRRFSDNDR